MRAWIEDRTIISPAITTFTGGIRTFKLMCALGNTIIGMRSVFSQPVSLIRQSGQPFSGVHCRGSLQESEGEGMRKRGSHFLDYKVVLFFRDKHEVVVLLSQ